MEAVLDQAGRVTLPLIMREYWGLKPGETLTIENKKDGIFLKPVRQTSSVINKNGLLVLTGNPTNEGKDIVKEVRNERLKSVLK